MLSGRVRLDLTFLPEPARPFRGRLFLYHSARPERAPQSSDIASLGLGAWLLHTEEANALLALRGGEVQRVKGLSVGVADAVAPLAAMRPGRSRIGRIVPASVRSWSVASKLALELVGGERMVPTVHIDTRRVPRAVWSVALTRDEDRQRRERLADAMPAAAFATIVDAASRVPRTWSPERLISAYLDAVADGLIRKTQRRRVSGQSRTSTTWERRLVRALTAQDNTLTPTSYAESGLLTNVAAWSAQVLETGTHPWRLSLTLEAPPDTATPWILHYSLQSTTEKNRVVPAQDVYDGTDGALHELLRGLAETARLSAPVERSLQERQPVRAQLSVDEAWTFLSETAPVLAQSGISVQVPDGLDERTRRRLRTRIRIGRIEDPEDLEQGARHIGSLGGIPGIVDYRWEVALGDDTLSEEEFREIAATKAPLIQRGGRWVIVDPREVERSRQLLAEGGGELASGSALAALATGEIDIGGQESVEVVVEANLSALGAWLREAEGLQEIPEPSGFTGSLRAYQQRGLCWLETMERLGIGCVLADEMGLGKTVQIIALLLHRPVPTLIVCPTSVIGNWQREIHRFAPELPVVRHHGADRATDARQLARQAGGSGAVLTTYAVVRRDQSLLSAVDWKRVVLDEAQAIKNPGARQTRALRAMVRTSSIKQMSGIARITLTGTPLENRLSELWSILDFCNPGLMGTLESFRRRFSTPIEQWQDEGAAATLHRLVQPFILRRLKDDPAVSLQLPEKNEMTVICSLTREQAALYQARLDAALQDIEQRSGMQRRGRILALITALKQICNHPAHFLKEPQAEPTRSGKLERLIEMLQTARANKEKSLVFTQFREMGDRLQATIRKELGEEVAYLHGGTPPAQRDAIVDRFQSDDGPPVFVLSVKAGGSGLNLTAATQVFHYDRWWNPAVEDQATDRAHRIGQTRRVQVYKLVTAGTIEEKIAEMLEAKRGLSDQILGSGESWLTELNDADLRALVALAPGSAEDLDEEEDDA